MLLPGRPDRTLTDMGLAGQEYVWAVFVVSLALSGKRRINLRSLVNRVNLHMDQGILAPEPTESHPA
jgi:hypothetical protein